MYQKKVKPIERLVIAWDLDGTLIDSSHRATFIDGEFCLKSWIKDCTEENIMNDSLLPLYEVYQEYKKTGFTQICVTARAMNKEDFDYLAKHGIEFDLILHRKDSQELDEVLKDRKLKEYFSDTGRIPFMAYDDKEENLEIFDQYGFRTFQAKYLNEIMKKDSYSEINFKPGEC